MERLVRVLHVDLLDDVTDPNDSLANHIVSVSSVRYLERTEEKPLKSYTNANKEVSWLSSSSIVSSQACAFTAEKVTG